MAGMMEVPDEAYALPLGVAEVKRSGSDVTVVAHGHLVVDALTAADELAKEGISLEVIDPTHAFTDGHDHDIGVSAKKPVAPWSFMKRYGPVVLGG